MTTKRHSITTKRHQNNDKQIQNHHLKGDTETIKRLSLTTRDTKRSHKISTEMQNAYIKMTTK